MRIILVSILGLSLVAGCSTSTSHAAAPRTLTIVAAENFWGSIASQLVGTAGHVTSVLSDPNADPHSYESSATDARAFAGADYAIINGAGYDAWAQHLLSGNPNSKRTVLTVADLLGKKDGDNPHFWYQPDYVTTVINQVEADLKALDPPHATYFDTQRTQLNQAFAPYRARLAEIKAKYSGTAVASTESIFVYLADYLGLNVISPADFMKAVAEGNDPPAPSVAQFQTQIAAKQMKILIYNQQTVTDVTSTLKKQATNAGIPVVGVTETIQPPDATFEQWFDAQLLQLQNALNADALGK
jgi:zinc/manganese transport system substrate-binding protein